MTNNAPEINLTHTKSGSLQKWQILQKITKNKRDKKNAQWLFPGLS